MATFSPAWLNRFGPLSHTGKRSVDFTPPGGGPFGPFCFSGSEVDANLYGGSFTDVNPDSLGVIGYGGTETETKLYGGTEVDPNAGLGGTQNSGCISTMQAVNITLGEFNDETINLTVTNNGSPFDLTSGPGYTLNAYLKVAVGDLDSAGTTKKYSSGVAITITNGPGGLATWIIPHADLQNTSYTFWRLDVVTVGTLLQATAMYGTVTMKSL